jgi:23S rRNA (cytosine1962-C5)-methyltransferase
MNKRPSFRQRKKEYDRVELHPVTIKELKKGHPWVIKDSFTERFPTKRTFLIGQNRKQEDVCLLLNDPSHKIIKARIWSFVSPFSSEVKNFRQELIKRIYDSIEKRINSDTYKERDNFYIVFGEGDQLPGIFIQVLDKYILCQFYSQFWEKYEETVFDAVRRRLSKYIPNKKFKIWKQYRNFKQDAPMVPTYSQKLNSQSAIISEFGVNYQIYLSSNYDLGIYSDMSSIRKELIPYFKKSQSLLNLFSYSGAFSLLALKHGIKDVCSVDLSSKYLEWLDRNLNLNKDLNRDNHASIKSSVTKSVDSFNKDNKKFDFIICDPPSSSSDGKKRGQAFKNYDTLLPSLINITNSKGYILVFLNTHQIKLKKFRTKVDQIIKESKKKISVVKQFEMSDDCPTNRVFHEGNYIKGILLQLN